MIGHFFYFIKLLIPDAFINYINDRGEIVERIAKGSFWLLFGAVFSRVIGLIISIIVARLLGQTLFGQYGIIQSTIIMFSTFAGFGLGITSTKYVAELRNSEPKLVGSIISSTNMIAIIMGFLFTILIVLFAPFIALKLIKAHSLINEIRFGSIILFFSALNGAQSGALTGFEAFKDISRLNIKVSLICLPIQIASTYFWSLEGAIIGLCVNYFMQYIFNYKTLRKIANSSGIEIKYFNKSFGDISYLWKFSLPAVLGGLLVNPVLWYCYIILVKNKNGFNEMAIYNAAMQWQNVILFIPMAISQIVLPLFSNVKNDKKNFLRVIKYNLLLNVFVALITAIVFSIFSKLIMNVYGNEYANANLVLIYLSLTAVLIAVNNVIAQVIACLGEMWGGFSLNLCWAFALIIFATIFLDQGLGAVGLAKAMLLSYLLHTFIVFFYTYFLLNKLHYKELT